MCVCVLFLYVPECSLLTILCISSIPDHIHIHLLSTYTRWLVLFFCSFLFFFADFNFTLWSFSLFPSSSLFSYLPRLCSNFTQLKKLFNPSYFSRFMCVCVFCVYRSAYTHISVYMSIFISVVLSLVSILFFFVLRFPLLLLKILFGNIFLLDR